MKTSSIGIALGFAACCGFVAVCASGAKPAAERISPRSVVIVKQAMHSEAGIARPETISIVNADKIATLEKMFPEYDQMKAGGPPAGWEMGYLVYFNFPKGRTLRLTLSFNDKGQTWSMGDGDFATRGNFQKFLKELE